MDENMKGSGHPEGCRCGMCKMGMSGMGAMMGGKHGMCGCHRGPLHLIVKIIVVVFIFWLGTQVGELRAYRGGMMGDSGGYGRGGMMSGYYDHGYGPTSATSSTQ